MRKVIGRFSADGSDGRSYAVEVVQVFGAHVVAGEAGEVRLFTSNGVPVARLARGSYRVPSTGVVLTSAAGNAV